MAVKAHDGQTRWAYQRMPYYAGSTSLELGASVQIGAFPFVQGVREIVATASVLGRTYTATEKFDTQMMPQHKEALASNLKAAPGYIEKAKKELAEKGPGARPELRAIYEKSVLEQTVNYGTYLIQDGQYDRGITMIEGVLGDLVPRMGDYQRDVLYGERPTARPTSATRSASSSTARRSRATASTTSPRAT
jgi:hypothetical protein